MFTLLASSSTHFHPQAVCTATRQMCTSHSSGSTSVRWCAVPSRWDWSWSRSCSACSPWSCALIRWTASPRTRRWVLPPPEALLTASFAEIGHHHRADDVPSSSIGAISWQIVERLNRYSIRYSGVDCVWLNYDARDSGCYSCYIIVL